MVYFYLLTTTNLAAILLSFSRWLGGGVMLLILRFCIHRALLRLAFTHGGSYCVAKLLPLIFYYILFITGERVLLGWLNC